MVIDRDLWGNDHFTGGELQFGCRTRGVTSIKGAALPAVGRCEAFQATIVHWRSDYQESLLLGEAVAISILRDQRETYNEHFPGFTFTKFDGTTITV